MKIAMAKYCTQCGDQTDIFIEGYCPECHKENQKQLDEYNFFYDRWQKMSEKERDIEIKRARS